MESQREEIREAIVRLPERQGEALALRERQRLSYEEIAAIMGTGARSVAQLISRARINLYDELRGTVLASVAPPSPDCERALPLIAAREDEQIEWSSGDAVWLDAHLAGCDRCRLAVEQMRDADTSYRAGVPIDAPGESPSGAPPTHPLASSRVRLSRGRASLAAGLAALLLLGGLAAAFVGDDGTPAPASPAAGAASGRGIGESQPGAKPIGTDNGKGGAAKENAKIPAMAAETNGSGAAAAGVAPTLVTVPSQATTDDNGAPSNPASGRTHPSGKTGVEPTKQTSSPKPTAKPAPAPTAPPTSQPASGPASTPAAEALPPAEGPPEDEPGRREEAPGKPPGRPPH